MINKFKYWSSSLLMLKAVALFFSLVLISCNTELDIEIPDHTGKLVIEGLIEQGDNPEVVLTLSAPFFSSIDSSNIRDFAVLTAKVTIESEDQSEILILKKSDRFFPPFVYFGIDLMGEERKEYTIRVNHKGREYEATTTIPSVVYPDSVWFKTIAGSDTLGAIWITFADNPNENNYYRVLFKRKGIDVNYISAFGAVFTDELFSGKTIDLSFTRGNVELLETEGNRYFRTGDTIAVKFCSIDKRTYDFWNTVNAQIISSANPFAASNASVKGNIEGGLGVWAGYAVAFDTVYAK